jgi:hypothetical protein
MTPRHYSRALPHICSPKAPVGAKHARAVLSQTLDDVHWGLAAKSLVGTHRKGKRNEWIRDITERDLPPWSMRGGMGASPKPMSPRTRRVQSLGTGKYCLHSDEHVSKHLAQRYARTPHHRTRPVAPRGVVLRARALGRRLEHGQRKDEDELARVLTSSTSVGSVNQIAERGIKPLMEMAESRYTEIQRDAAAALYSLSISDGNKVAFMVSAPALKCTRAALSTDVRVHGAGGQGIGDAGQAGPQRRHGYSLQRRRCNVSTGHAQEHQAALRCQGPTCSQCTLWRVGRHCNRCHLLICN